MLSTFQFPFRLCILLGIAFFFARPLDATDAPSVTGEHSSGVISIELENGVNRKSREGTLQWHPITLDFVCENGAWQKDVWGFNAGFSRAMHRGELTESLWKDSVLHLVAKVIMNREALGEDLEGTFGIDLKFPEPRTSVSGYPLMEGAYTGTYRNEAIKGAAHATIKPLPAKIAGIDDIKNGEHPRLVFRKSELPKIKESARTPAGAAILARLQAMMQSAHLYPKAYVAAAHGLLYRLNDDPQEAEVARQINEVVLRDDFCANRYLSSDALIGVALTYDLCYDAWTPEYRGVVSAFLEDRINYMLITSGESPARYGNTPQLSDYEVFPGNEWQAVVRGAAAFAALAILHDPAPPVPADDGGEPKWKTIAAIPNLDLGRAVPIAKFEDSAVPENWIYAGPFVPPPRSAWGPVAPQEPVDFLESIGGHASARADVGTRVRAFGMTRDFAAVPGRAVLSIKAGNERSYVDVGAALDGALSSDNDNANVAYFYTVIENEKTRPVKLATHNWNYVPEMSLWISGTPVGNNEAFTINEGRHTLLVRVALLPRQTMAWIAPRLKELTEDDAQQEQRSAAWVWSEKRRLIAERGATFERVKDNEFLAEAALTRFFAMGLYDCADESNPALPAALSQSVLPFLVAYRNTRGADFATGTSAETILPFCLMQTIAAAATRAANVSERPNGTPLPLTYVRGSGMRGDIFTTGMGNLAESQRATVKSAFDLVWGMSGDKTFGIVFPHQAVYALANLAITSRDRKGAGDAALTEPPKTFEDTAQNLFVFRNAFKDSDDIVATVNLGAFRIRHQTREMREPPFFRIAGLGAHWQLHDLREVSARNREDRPEDSPAFHKDTFAPKPDGSGFIAAISEGAQPGAVRKLFAADYSGKSGAPALFVLAQKGARCNWRFDATGNYSVTVGASDRSFKFTAPNGATLQGTLVGSVARIETHSLSNALSISGPSDCVLVLTLQKGNPPEVKAEGAGMAQKIGVGAQIVEFDGENINFAK